MKEFVKTLIGITLIVLAFLLGRMMTDESVFSAGFDAGVREGTTDWEEWR